MSRLILFVGSGKVEHRRFCTPQRRESDHGRPPLVHGFRRRLLQRRVEALHRRGREVHAVLADIPIRNVLAIVSCAGGSQSRLEIGRLDLSLCVQDVDVPRGLAAGHGSSCQFYGADCRQRRPVRSRDGRRHGVSAMVPSNQASSPAAVAVVALQRGELRVPDGRSGSPCICLIAGRTGWPLVKDAEEEGLHGPSGKLGLAGSLPCGLPLQLFQ